MKTIFRLSMAMAVALLLAWGGVAEPGEEFFGGTDYEYLAAMEAGTLPMTPIDPFGVRALDVAAPEPGTWEYGVAMETGNLPSACAGELCGPEEYPVAEFGGIHFRLPLDVGP